MKFSKDVVLTFGLTLRQYSHILQSGHCQLCSWSMVLYSLSFLKQVKWPRLSHPMQLTKRPFLMSLRPHTIHPLPSSHSANDDAQMVLRLLFMALGFGSRFVAFSLAATFSIFLISATCSCSSIFGFLPFVLSILGIDRRLVSFFTIEGS